MPTIFKQPQTKCFNDAALSYKKLPFSPMAELARVPLVIVTVKVVIELVIQSYNIMVVSTFVYRSHRETVNFLEVPCLMSISQPLSAISTYHRGIAIQPCI